MIIKFWILAAFCLTGFNATRLAAAQVQDEPSGFHLIIELKDGSRLVGDNIDDTFQLRSDILGKIKLPLGKIRSVDCSSQTNRVEVVTTNGDSITAEFLSIYVSVGTAFGDIKLPSGLIRHIQISPAGKTVLLQGLVALWSGEGNGVDSVGGHNAIVPADVTFVPSKIGLGFNFDGQAHRVIVPDAPELNFGANQDFSICAWIMALPPPPVLTTGVMSIVDKRSEEVAADDSPGYELILVNGQLHFRFMHTGYGSAGPDLRDGLFHHVAVTVARNSPAGGHLYVDGKAILTFDTTGEAGDLTNAEPLRIGNHCNPNYFSYFHGVIDELGIYKVALSANDIQELYENQ